MKAVNQAGFSLVELAIVILIFGATLAFSVPAINGFSKRHQLRGAIENISGQLRLARESAIATGNTQNMHFTADYSGCDYHIHNNGVVDPKWSLPKGVSYYWGTGTQNQYRLTKDGRSLDTGMIILQDTRGYRDTVSVLASGLVLIK